MSQKAIDDKTTLVHVMAWCYEACFLSRVAVDFAQSIEARCWVENEDVVGAATNYIWVINNVIAYQGVIYIRGFPVYV